VIGERSVILVRGQNLEIYVVENVCAHRGMQFCRELPQQAGIVAIPAAVLYDPRHENEGRHLVRFAFCKQLSTISLASEKLRAWA
jgi:aspartate/methionine/tyrosine aminotransferase